MRRCAMNMTNNQSNDFVVIKAVEDGVNVIGLTRGRTRDFIIQKSLIKEK